MRYLAIGGMTIDDVVLEDGTYHASVPGGNALYSALGARLWSAGVGVMSFAGSDYPPAILEQLRASGIDVTLVARLEMQSVHLWILYEPDGRRQIFYQQRSSHLGSLTRIAEDGLLRLRDTFPDVRAVHVAALPVAVQAPILQALSLLRLQVTVDSIEAHGSVGGDLQAYRDRPVLRGTTAFLPSREEFDVLRGDSPEDAAAWSLAGGDLGHVVVKQGRAGATVYGLAKRSTVSVPAYPVEVRDPTGAGDAFCGGFMVGMAETNDPVEAALRGAVSASFVIEAVGALHVLDVNPREAMSRLDALRRQRAASGPAR